MDTAEYIASTPEAEHHAAALDRLARCGEYLLFRHYYTVDQVRLHAARFCMIHLLCPLCAIRRGARALGSYLERYESIRATNGALRPFLVTLTVKDGPDLAERFNHLRDAFQRFMRRRQGKGGEGSVARFIAGAVWSYEVKRGKNSGLWHPHVHAIALAHAQPDALALRNEWHALTRDSHIVDVRPIDTTSPAGGFAEVFKYAVKFSDMEPADTVHAYHLLRGKRLVDSAGLFRGVDVPDSLTDEPLDGLPYVELFYRYIARRGYSLATH